MNARDELVERLVERRARRLGELSEGGREELERAVRENPSSFVDDADDAAFARLAEALDRHARARSDEDLLDDDAYLAARAARLRRLVNDCQAIVASGADCLDAALVAVLAADAEPAETLEGLLELRGRVGEDGAGTWNDVRDRARLRLDAAIARTCLESGHYRMAVDACEHLMALDADDHLGARRTCVLALARLEDETAFDELDQRFERRGDSWSHLARTILLYKLGRLDAARRALVGYSRLVVGGAYALLRPIVIDTYLPDRPDVPSLGYEEASMAVWEAEPIIVDTPDLPDWAAGIPTVSAAGRSFAERYDLDW